MPRRIRQTAPLPPAARRGAAVAALAALGYPVCLWLCEGLASLLLSAAGGLPGAGPANPAGVNEAPALLLWAGAAALALLLPGAWAARALRLPRARLAPGRARGRAPGWFPPLFLGAAALASTLGGRLGRALGLPARQTLLPAGGWALAAAFVALCLLPAASEELFFRGVLQTALRPFGPGAAVLGSALLFALCHGSPAQALSALVSGLLLGLFAEWRGSVWPGAALHLVNNALAFWCAWLAQYADGELAAALGLAAGLGCLVWGCAAAWQAQKLRPAPAKGAQLPAEHSPRPRARAAGPWAMPGGGPGISALFGCPAWRMALAALSIWMLCRWIF